ncbi:hypothetical protein ACWCPB_35510, partial [Streptomyces sp. NPDC001811]
MTDPNAIQPSALDQLPDRDPEETAEWQASLDAVAREAGPHRAAYLMRRTLERAEAGGIALPKLLETDYVNTIPTSAEPALPGDPEMEARITAWNRWNAAAMVTRGAKHGVGADDPHGRGPPADRVGDPYGDQEPGRHRRPCPL